MNYLLARPGSLPSSDHLIAGHWQVVTGLDHKPLMRGNVSGEQSNQLSGWSEFKVRVGVFSHYALASAVGAVNWVLVHSC